MSEKKQPKYASATGPITNALQSSGTADRMTAHWLTWRTGRKVGRTIYAQVGAEPSDNDLLIGVMDLPRLAQEAVGSHNTNLARVQRIDSGDKR